MLKHFHWFNVFYIPLSSIFFLITVSTASSLTHKPLNNLLCCSGSPTHCQYSCASNLLLICPMRQTKIQKSTCYGWFEVTHDRQWQKSLCFLSLFLKGYCSQLPPSPFPFSVSFRESKATKFLALSNFWFITLLVVLTLI